MAKNQLNPKANYKKTYAKEFFNLSSNGYFPTEIAAKLGVPLKHLQRWSKDVRKPEFGQAWDLGKEACEAFHISKLNKMIDEGASGPMLQSQQFILTKKFKENWSDKQEAKIELTSTEQMTDEQLKAQITRYLLKPNTKNLLKQILEGKNLLDLGDTDDKEKSA